MNNFKVGDKARIITRDNVFADSLGNCYGKTVVITQVLGKAGYLANVDGLTQWIEEHELEADNDGTSEG